MTTFLHGYYDYFDKLVIELKSKLNGDIHISYLKLDDNPLVTPENAEAWSTYLQRRLKSLVTEEAMQSEEFQEIQELILEKKRRHDEWIAGEPERRRREKHRKELHRTPSLGFIPDGLQVDYEKEYGWYIDSAIQWTPEDNEDFLYQIRSLERMCTKCHQRCIDLGRPDAAYAQDATLLRALPKWRDREELTDFFNQYKPRLRKLVKFVCHGMLDAAIAWNHNERLLQANALIEAFQSEFLSWGVKPKDLLSLRFSAIFRGGPITIERKPNKQELYEIQQAKRRQEAEERRKAEEEAEKHSLIPLNQHLEQTIFTRRNVDWECLTIGRAIIPLSDEVQRFIDRGQSREAILLFLQIVKSMCRHFVRDEHYDMFDDTYDPEYSCIHIVDLLNTAFHHGKLTQSDLEFFHNAWKEIEQMEACTDYGLCNFKFKF